MPIERINFRLTDISLEYMSGPELEEWHADLDISNIILISEGSTLSLQPIRVSSSQWTSNDCESVALSTQAEALSVVLQGKDHYDIAYAVVSIDGPFGDELPPQQRPGEPQRVEMKDLSVCGGTGRWVLSWKVWAVNTDEISSTSPEGNPVRGPSGCNEEQGHVGAMLRFTDFSLKRIPGGGEDHGNLEVGQLVFIAEGPRQMLSLIPSSLNHWVVKDSAPILVAAQTQVVIVVLQDKDVENIGAITLSQRDFPIDVLAGVQGVQLGECTRVSKMENLSPDTENGHWFLSWHMEMVDMDVNPSPVPVRRSAGSAAPLDDEQSVDTEEISLPGPIHSDAEHHMELDEDLFHLTDFTVTYSSYDYGPHSINLEAAKMVIFVGNHCWSLNLTASSTNRWKSDGSSTIAISRDTESFTVTLQDKALVDVAFGSVPCLEKCFRDCVMGVELGDTDDCINESARTSVPGSSGSWWVTWKVLKSMAVKWDIYYLAQIL
ncbi:hypothetical protein BKA70DRAFT_1293193 [Coprinopsis sp. MPI-PUGE-AT-0042]|nr:hypothetical protein BKA70DRAFT_1293193 [Coprinopsis sp. MPI-PUGE-AT-0042]